jgi:hypothetical protein
MVLGKDIMEDYGLLLERDVNPIIISDINPTNDSI